MTSRIPAVSTGKPSGSIEQLYTKYKCSGVDVWIDSVLDDNEKILFIGYRKFLFLGELILKFSKL